MVTEYVGETTAKRLARLYTYQRIVALQPQDTRHNHEAVVLCGPDAGEIGLLKHMLVMPPYGVTFVDWESKSGLNKAVNRWPGAKGFFGDVKHVLKTGPANLSLVNLDLMGYLNKERLALVELAGNRIAPWGMLFYTYFRGREQPPFWKNLNHLQGDPKHKRLIGNAKAMKESLPRQFEPVFVLNYTSFDPDKRTRHSAMTVIGFQHIPLNATLAERRVWQMMKDRKTNVGAESGEMPNDTQESMLSWQASKLKDQGHTSSQIAEMLNLSTGSVGAMLANVTRKIA